MCSILLTRTHTVLRGAMGALQSWKKQNDLFYSIYNIIRELVSVILKDQNILLHLESLLIVSDLTMKKGRDDEYVVDPSM